MTTHDDTPIYLMCPPEHFAIEADPSDGFANDMSIEGAKVYARDPAGFRRRAMRQWEAFRDILTRDIGAEIIELEPQPGLDDQVFAADASISLIGDSGGVALLSNFTFAERQAEVELHERALRAFDPEREIVRATHPIEGCGDNVYDPLRDLFWSGCAACPSRAEAGSGRSDARAHEQLSAVTGAGVVTLEVRRPFFHLDTAVAVLPRGHVLCCRDGLSVSAHQRLCDCVFTPFGLSPEEHLIEVTRSDAERYACNVVTRGDTVVLPLVSDQLIETIREKGYDPIPADLSQFILSGGGPHCLTNRVNERRTGGLVTEVLPLRDRASR